jgi:regulator of nucleoside diphosphate kinase
LPELLPENQEIVVTATKKVKKPPIVIGQTDHEKLTRLAEALAERNPDLGNDLLAELDRARIVPDAKVPANVVRMGSTLRYTTDGGEDRTVTLVFPGEADIASGKISVMTPIGAALVGLAAGQTIDWAARDGRVHLLTVETVQSPTSVTA